MLRPLCDRPMTSEWYQVLGFVIAATALVRARSVALVIRPVALRWYLRCRALTAFFVRDP